MDSNQMQYLKHTRSQMDLIFNTGDWDSFLTCIKMANMIEDTDFRDKVLDTIVTISVDKFAKNMYNSLQIIYHATREEQERYLSVSNLVTKFDPQAADRKNVAKLSRNQVDMIPKGICSKIAVGVAEDLAIQGYPAENDPNTQPQAYLWNMIKVVKRADTLHNCLNNIVYQNYNKHINIESVITTLYMNKSQTVPDELNSLLDGNITSGDGEISESCVSER